MGQESKEQATMTHAPWKTGRGALGPMLPLLGTWRHSGPAKLGAVKCVRSFDRVLGGKFIQLRAEWRSPGKIYEEVAFFGLNREKQLAFWSFTSDGAQSQGSTSKAPDVHPRCVCFEADMPAGRARMLYWPHELDGFWFAVEALNKNGWRRFLAQHFKPAAR